MNRFRSRKKSYGGGESTQGSRRPSLDSDVPPVPSFSSRTFKRKKQVAPEPKPEVDLTSALPPSDDFRTSLLMPNLSARFSMLREQDDPKSKLGKANDDSVLFPKRASRLDIFNRQGLSDIAEVDSLRGSIRPPFASARTESYGSDGYATDEGSVMSRSRPGEGNTMFGGRQKIYKIPVNGAGSVKIFGATGNGELPSGGNMGGKALYESDIASSAFQKLREQEREEREKAGTDHHNIRSSKEQDRSGSPPSARYNRNRETSSSTNSGPSQPRTSTAATSVASQRSIYGAHEYINGSSHALSSNTQQSSASSDRPLPKSRRLYGQGLDQHMYEQQSSAMIRLESLHRQRTAGGGAMPRNLQQSMSASNLNDRYQSGGPLYSSNGFRAGSPPPSATPPRMADFDLGLMDEKGANNHTDSGYGRSPPLSPPMSLSHDPNNHDTTFVAALEPNDLGKATASGAFNKPSKQYNEQQYLQRQMQLQEGRSPSPQLVRPFSPQALSIDEQTTGRSRNNSLGSNFSRSNSVRHPWEHHMEDRALRAASERSNMPPVQRDKNFNQEAMERSFLAGMSGSDVGSQPESESEADPFSPLPSRFQNHGFPFSITQKPKTVDLKDELEFKPDPGHLNPHTEESAFDSRSYRSETTITQPIDNPPPGDQNANIMDADSPTLGPVGVSNGLSGIVRAHLRNESGGSSIYPEESPKKSNFPLPAEARESIFGHESALKHIRQESWETGITTGDYWGEEKRGSEQSGRSAMPPPLSFAARLLSDQTTPLRNKQGDSEAKQMLGTDKAQQILGEEAPRSSHSRNNSTSWQEQLRAHHARIGSTDTQHEREGLANELAQRRRMVQKNLESYVDSESRSGSPGPGARTQDNTSARPAAPFGILKKTSRSSLVGRQERPSKAMKMLGITPGSEPGSSQPPPPDMFMGRGQLSDRAMPPGQRGPLQPRRPQDIRQHSDNISTPRTRELQSHQSQENFTQRASKSSSKSSSSQSDHSDRRSGSRKGSTAKASMERNRANGYNPVVEASALEPRDILSSPRPTDELMASIASHGLPPIEKSPSVMAGRLRSNSKPGKPNYFEPRVAPPGTPHMINPSSRPSAKQYSYSAQSTPSLHERRPSLSSTTTTSSTPTMIPPQTSPNRAYSRPGNYRKRSINKHDISEPIFLSCTSSVDTVNLAPGASLSNGMDSPPYIGDAPPIPTRDSRRKRTQTLLQALGRIEKPEPTSALPTPSPRDDDPYEERSTFSADDEPSFKQPRQRLRKTSSESGSMAAKARQQALQSPAPPMPNLSEMQGPGVEHFQYQAQHDVPASAVMF
ncbi:hypothetical protein MMC28_000569 [Mycoblastus sanguinarius]|nr:hypothetical protein [Mycoblastus sanguinarius]